MSVLILYSAGWLLAACSGAKKLTLSCTSIYAAGFTDVELALVYRHALAVVIPSRIEGFGLPAIEVAAGGLPLLADSRGLREAGGERR